MGTGESRNSPLTPSQTWGTCRPAGEGASLPCLPTTAWWRVCGGKQATPGQPRLVLTFSKRQPSTKKAAAGTPGTEGEQQSPPGGGDLGLEGARAQGWGPPEETRMGWPEREPGLGVRAEGGGDPGEVQGERPRGARRGKGTAPRAPGCQRPGPAPSLTGRSTLTSVPSSRKTRQYRVALEAPAAEMCTAAPPVSRGPPPAGNTLPPGAAGSVETAAAGPPRGPPSRSSPSPAAPRPAAPRA